MSPDASPEATNTELDNLEPDSALEAKLADQEAEERARRKADKLYVYVRHTGRTTATRAQRKARAGNRRQGVVLDNGLRIRKKGRQRVTKLGLRDLVANHRRLFHYLDNHILEVLDPDMKPISRDRLAEILESLAKGMGRKVSVPKVLVPYSRASGLKAGKRPVEDVQEEPESEEETGSTEGPEGEEETTAVTTEAGDSSEEETEGTEGEDTSGEAEGTEDSEEDELTEDDLKKMSRAELDEIASASGLTSSDYSSNAKLITALLEQGE
jgi:hypothetical protein